MKEPIKKRMRGALSRAIGALLAGSMLACMLVGCAGGGEKNITVVVWEQGSGTREAFDQVVTDGEHYLEEKDAEGKKVYNTVITAIQQTKTGTVLSTIAADVNAIGYVSVGSLNDSVRVVKVNGVAPTDENVLNGTYTVQRPFVVMTTTKTALTARAADFVAYLESEAARDFAEEAGGVFLTDTEARGGVALAAYTRQESLPGGEKLVIRGSTSMEKWISSAAKAYAALYDAAPEDLFDIQLEGSSVGRKAVENDTVGNVIGLSSASVQQEGIRSFRACLDAVAVIVNSENETVSDLTLRQLYDIFSGRITKFSELSAA